MSSKLLKKYDNFSKFWKLQKAVIKNMEGHLIRIFQELISDVKELQK